MAATYFNKRRNLGILEKDLGSSDVISVFTAERVKRFTVRVLPTYLFIYLFIYRFVQCTGERTIGHVVPYLVHPPNPTP